MEAVQARLSLHLSKCHIVGNHMSWLIWDAGYLEGLIQGPLLCLVQTLPYFVCGSNDDICNKIYRLRTG